MLSSLRRPQPYPHKGRALLAIQANLAAHRSRGGGGGSVAERDLPNEVPELRYVEVEDQARLASMRFESSNWWGVQIPIALCVRCATRRTRTRTLMESPYTITRRMILRSCAATVIAQRLARL